MTKVQFLLFLSLLQLHLYSQNCQSTGNGDWNEPSSWSCGHVPTCGDNIVIVSGHTITVSEQNNYEACPSPISILVEGELAFTNGNKIQLPCGSSLSISPSGIIYKNGNGGGNSTLLSICNSTIWSAGDGDFNGPYNYGMPLPIELILFEATYQPDVVYLNWSTASEKDVDYFDISRSKDGVVFEKLFQVKATGNTSSISEYKSSDNNPIEGIIYYKLQSYDLNGSKSFETIKTIEINKKNIVKPYGNIITQGSHFKFLIEGEAPQDIKVYASSGQEVPVVIHQNNDIYQVANTLPQGLYIVKVKLESKFETLKFIIQ